MSRMLRACVFAQSRSASVVFRGRLGENGRSSCQGGYVLQSLAKVSPNKRPSFQYCSCSMTVSPLQSPLPSSSSAGPPLFHPFMHTRASPSQTPSPSEDMRPMAEQSAQELILKVPGWSLISEDGTLKLQKAWRVKSFTKGLEFFQAVADAAEAEGHHPDLHLVGCNNVKIEIWTHSVGGLTENDFILATKINSLDLEHLLRRKAAV